MKQKLLVLSAAALIGANLTNTAYAGEIGHFSPGAYNIRDFALPDPGFYWGAYNYGYRTTRANDANGNKIGSLTLTGPGNKTTTLNLNVNISAYAFSPFVMWVSAKKV